MTDFSQAASQAVTNSMSYQQGDLMKNLTRDQKIIAVLVVTIVVLLLLLCCPHAIDIWRASRVLDNFFDKYYP